ncbi:MAG TPA: hypothetical protein VKU02_19785 [Gemmataceae bacterium]|nr:hypothetical protein [Gemmataceae bacterium]
MIVRSPDAVPFAVSKLALHDIRPETVLIGDGAGSAAKTVAGRT